MHQIIITSHSYDLRLLSFNNYTKLIQSSLQDKEVAREQGDLSENFGYVEAKNEVEKYRRMQQELGLSLESLVIINPINWATSENSNSRVQIGKVIKLQINGDDDSIFIGGAWDADLKNDNIAPYTSPLAQCILNKTVGEIAMLPANKLTIKILKVETPTLEFLEKLYPKKVKKEKEQCMEL